MIKQQYNILSINLDLSDVCCCVLKYNLGYIDNKVFKHLCIFNSINNKSLSFLKQNTNNFIIVNVLNYLERDFNISFLYSYEFRKNNNINLPDIPNIYSNTNKKIFLEFLIKEYIDDINLDIEIRNIANPLFDYNPLNCLSDSYDNSLYIKRIINIPYFGVLLDSTFLL